MKDVPIIVCPICGEELLMSEVYVPQAFFGKQKEIIKDSAGHIDYYIGSDPDLDEEYICDNCGAHLKIHANVSFDVTSVSDDFEEEYVTEINKPKKITLKEESIF